MVTLNNFPFEASNGDILAASGINTMMGVLGKNAIRSRAGAYFGGGSFYASGEGFYAENLFSSYAPSGNNNVLCGSPSTAGIGKNGVISLATGYDNFYSNTIDTGLWQTVTTGPGGAGSIIFQSGNGLTIRHTSAGSASSPKYTLSYTSGTSNNLLVSGADAEIIVPFFTNIAAGGGFNLSGNLCIVATDGTNYTKLGSYAGNTGVTSSSGGYFRVVYNDASGTANVFRRQTSETTETQIGSNLAITAGRKFLGAVSEVSWFGGSSTDGSTVAELTIFGIGYYRSGTASSTVTWTYSGASLPLAKSGGMVSFTEFQPRILNPGSVSAVMNTNGGTTYGSLDATRNWNASPAVGSSLKFKATFPTIGSMNDTGINIPVLSWWGSIHE